jgi:peptidoglycan DL-endopeptidase CwlO
VRPVNLIPPEDRRGEKAPLRTGPLSYVIVAVLAVALLGVTLVVVTGNQVADRQAQKANLEAQVAQAQAEAQRLRSFTDFASLQQARQDTVTSLATSRFDWERVLRELAIVIPSDVWLTDLSASASASAAATSSSSSTTSSTGASGIEAIQGPSLDIKGCAAGHDSVAGFLAALRDVDGVTRVTVLSSDRTSASGTSDSSAPVATSGDGAAGVSCPTKSFISTFEVVAAFDGVQPAATAAPSTGTTTTTTPATTPTTTTDTTATTSADTSQISDAQQQLQQQQDSAAQKTAQGHKAVDTLIPGTGSAP